MTRNWDEICSEAKAIKQSEEREAKLHVESFDLLILTRSFASRFLCQNGINL